MTREAFHAHEREKARRQGMDGETFDRGFRTYLCLCGGAHCPGWQTLTELEADMLVATQANLGHSAGFQSVFGADGDDR